MDLFTIEWTVNLDRNFTDFLVRIFKFYKNLVQKNKIYSKFLRIDSVIVILLITSLSSTFLTHRYPDYYYYYDDELVDVVLYLRDKAEPNSKILREDFDSAVIFRMLYDMKVKKWDLNRTSTLDDLLLEISERDIDYLIFSKDFFDNSTIDDLITGENNFKELIDNEEFYLFKIKH